MLLKNAHITFSVPSAGHKWCEVTCMVVPDIRLDRVKYSQTYRIWELNISMVFTGHDNTVSYDHKVYYFCNISGRWVIGDLLNQQFALISHPLLDRIKLKVLEHYPELVTLENPADEVNANAPAKAKYDFIGKTIS